MNLEFRTLRYLSGLFLAAIFLFGCVPATKQQDGEGNFDGIYIVENRSVDAEVREDFAAAMKLLKQEQYSQAVGLLKEVVKGSQNNSAPYINMALAYEKLGEMGLAEESLIQALEINPEHPVANNEYALLFRRTGRYIEAKQHYERIVQRYPEFMPARKNYGILCDLYLNDTACALQQYEIYSQANPADEDVKLWITTLKQRL